MNDKAIFGLKGKIVLVTGSSSGIGKHIAGVYAKAGAKVALAARRTEKTEAAAHALVGLGYQACSIYLDVTKPSTIKTAFDSIENQLGGSAEILFNNSGIIYAERFIDQNVENVSSVIDTNLKGAFLVAQEASRRMVASGQGGCIINVASTAGLAPGALFSSYCASKAGLVHLTKVMALELARKGIRVNVICPGNIETDMLQIFKDKGVDKTLLERIPQRRIGKLEDLDGIALLLASNASSYITGASIPVDGGQLLSWM